MSSTVRAKAKTRPKAKGERGMTTTGEILPDGTMIELVSGFAGTNKPHLLLWNGKARVAPRVEYGDCTYEASSSPRVCIAPRVCRSSVTITARSASCSEELRIFSSTLSIFLIGNLGW